MDAAILPPCDVGLCDPEHVDGRLVQPDEHAVEDLAETEQLQNLAHLGADAVDTGKQSSAVSIRKDASYKHQCTQTSGFINIGLLNK
jgi:hypothetical protein